MSTPRLLIFDDGHGQWGPMTDLRAVFSIRTGAVNNRVRIETSVGIMATDLVLDAAVAPLYRETESDARCNEPLRRNGSIKFHAHAGDMQWKPLTVHGAADVLLVNGRWSALGIDTVRHLPLGRALVQPDGEIIAAHLPCDAAQQFLDRGCRLDPATPCEKTPANALIFRPWDILAALEPTLRADLARSEVPLWNPRNRQAAPTVACLGEGAIRVAATARVHPMVVLNSEKGPIVIHDHAIIGSFSVIAGPCSIGPHTIVQPHAHIRANTSIGPHCLVAGEISHSIIQGYSNKAHTGYLGNSLIGEWVNLGADTNVSNLKNTYGPVRVQLSPVSPAENSGQSKQGPIIGDFVRTSIGSRLPTGSCYSTGTMLALSGVAPKFTPRFSFLTDDGPPDEKYDTDKFLAAARTATARRDCKLSPATEARLRALFSLR